MSSFVNGGWYYPAINGYNGSIAPSSVHVKNTGLSQFFKRYLLQEAISVYDWTIPESWDRDYFLYVLYVWGYIGIIDTDKFEVIPQHGTLGGYTVFYGPRYITITNPVFRQTYRPEIGLDCVLLKMQPDYMGLYDIVDYYGDMMAVAAEAMGVNLMNTKLAYVFAADGKAEAESYKKLMDDVASGEIAVIADKKLFDDMGNLKMQLFNRDIRNTYIGNELLETLRSLRCEFLTKIGVQNTNLYKASGVAAEEVAANNEETQSLVQLWLDNLKRGCKQAREMFGINLDVRFREGGYNNGEIMGLNSGDL